MLCILNDVTNPYFNLASEEYILKEFKEECFILWRNEPAIIVGKNQNTLSEINYEYVKDNNIPVVRRLSGGGAVFHDLGNLNFTFTTNDKNSFNDFRKFTQPIIDILNKLSINAEFSGRNDITIDGKKISGNAQCSYKDRMFHHGTLLFSSNVSSLSSALKAKPEKFIGKGIKSVSSRVTNISEYLTTPMTVTDFRDTIINHIVENNPAAEIYEFTKHDIERINSLKDEKYSTWEWNYGSSPKYNFTNSRRFTGGTVEFNISVNKGIIEDIKLYGDFFGQRDVSELEKTLIGINHNEESIRAALDKFDISKYFYNISRDELIQGMVSAPSNTTL